MTICIKWQAPDGDFDFRKKQKQACCRCTAIAARLFSVFLKPFQDLRGQGFGNLNCQLDRCFKIVVGGNALRGMDIADRNADNDGWNAETCVMEHAAVGAAALADGSLYRDAELFTDIQREADKAGVVIMERSKKRSIGPFFSAV